MATMQDVWNEIDSRIDARFRALTGDDSSSEGATTPPASSGGLPIHNNLHHEPPLALESALTAHIATIASADDLGHIRIGDGLSIDGDGILSVTTADLLSFLELSDTPDSYAGQATKIVRVKADVTGLEFHTLTASDIGALTQAAADLLYDPIGEAAAEVAAHVLALDPHTQYYNQARGDARYALIDHIQAVDKGGTGLTSVVADRIIYSSAPDTFSATPITVFGRSLIDDADAEAARITLELVAGGDGDIWVEKAGDTMTGDLLIQKATAVLTVESISGTATLIFDSPAGQQSQLNFYSDNLARWIFLKNAVAESGGNAGSDLQLLRRTDAGGSLSSVFYAERSTGFIGINRTTSNVPTYQLDVNGTFRVESTTGGVATIARNDTSLNLGDSIGKIEFYGNDTQLTTQNIFGNIEVQAQAAIGTDAAFGKMLLRTTGIGAGTSPVERLALGLVKNLTDAATNLFDVTLNAGEMAGGTVIWTIVASNGTDHQAYSGVTTYAVVNKAGAYTSQITHNTTNDAKAVSSGTLTAVWAILTGANKVTIRVTPTGSLTETTYQILYSVHSNSPQSIAVL